VPALSASGCAAARCVGSALDAGWRRRLRARASIDKASVPVTPGQSASSCRLRLYQIGAQRHSPPRRPPWRRRRAARHRARHRPAPASRLEQNGQRTSRWRRTAIGADIESRPLVADSKVLMPASHSITWRLPSADTSGRGTQQLVQRRHRHRASAAPASPCVRPPCSSGDVLHVPGAGTRSAVRPWAAASATCSGRETLDHASRRRQRPGRRPAASASCFPPALRRHVPVPLPCRPSASTRAPYSPAAARADALQRTARTPSLVLLGTGDERERILPDPCAAEADHVTGETNHRPFAAVPAATAWCPGG
jgi:hypothetical protein